MYRRQKPTWSIKRRIAVGCAVAAIGLAVSACGVPIDTTAHALPPVKFGPTTTTVPSSTTTLPSSANPSKSYSVYFLLHGVLTPVTRPDPSANTPVTPTIAIAALDNGPNAQEVAAGYQSALTQAPGSQVSVVSVTNGTITVALNANFVNLLLGQNLPEAYGQIVLTLTEASFPEIKTVQFVYDNAPLAALLPNAGIATNVGRCDFAAIARSDVKKQCKNNL